MERIEIFNKGGRSFVVNDLVLKGKKEVLVEKVINPTRMVTLEKKIAEKLLEGYPRELIRSSEEKDDTAVNDQLEAEKKKLAEERKKFEKEKKDFEASKKEEKKITPTKKKEGK
jgi:hypothetical protein